jgi:diguanylate cyclase (GGDEF)-like protein
MLSIQFEKYVALLEKLVPVASGFALCDATGLVVLAHGDAVDVACGDYQHAGTGGHADNAQPQTEANVLRVPGDRMIIRLNIFSSNGDELGALLVGLGRESSTSGADAIHAYERSLHAVASCIGQECELTMELDAMSQELANRYEELNLVYRSNEDTVAHANENEVIDSLLRNYVEYLDVSLVGLVLHGQDKIHYAVSKTNPVREPYQVVRNFANALTCSTAITSTSLIINDLDDRQRKHLALGIPYKVIVSPVLDNKGRAIAALICINHLSKPDFLNSDRNLLDVMSRKVSKIIHTSHDVLTGLINQHAFTRILQDTVVLAREKGVTHVYLNIDLDRLSVINDTIGRDAGDKAITFVSALLKNRLRSTDTVGYMGEGRFGVVLDICTLEQGNSVAKNLAEAIVETPFVYRSENVELSASIGVVYIGPDAESADELLESGELARNAAKKNGRSQIKIYSGESAEIAERKEQMQWVNRIQKAIRGNQLRIYCQEIRSTGIDTYAYHFEILVRMLGEHGETIPPNRFIPTAERYNMMPALDRWIIDNTFARLRDNGLAQQSRQGMVSINLSGQSLADEGLAEYISELLSRYQLQSDCICFEVTETSAFGNMQSAKRIIQRLKAIGCCFSLDDFGTGLSSFSYLKELPVDYLKIDGSFVRVIREDKIAHAMVSSINYIGHVMSLKTVAEYVENEEIATQLRLIGVDYLQGYVIGKPLPLEDYLAEHGLAAVTRAG